MRYQHESALSQTNSIKADIINLEESILRIEDRILNDTNTERTVLTLESQREDRNENLKHMKIAYARLTSKSAVLTTKMPEVIQK